MDDSSKYTLTLNSGWPAIAGVGAARTSAATGTVGSNGRVVDDGVGGPLAVPPKTWVEPHRVAVEPPENYAGTDRPAGGGGEMRRLQQVMRGRYLLAIGLSTALAVGGGYLGFHNGKRVFASAGQVRVKPYLPAILHSNDENGDLPAIDSFVEAQVALMKSQRVADLAMQDPAWASLGRGRSDQAMMAYMQAVTVTRDGDMIQVQAVDADPAAAVIEVRTMVTAYQKIYNEEDAHSGERRLDVLQALQTTRTNDVNRLRQQILDVAKVYGSDDLKTLYNFKQDLVNKLEARIADRTMELTAAQQATSGVTTGSAADLPKDPTPEQWARYSGSMGKMLEDRDRDQERLEQLQVTGSGAASPSVQTAQDLLGLEERRVAQLADKLKADRANGWVPTPVVAAAAPGGGGEARGSADLNALRQDIQLLGNMKDKANADMIAVGQQELHIQEMQAESDQAKHDRDEAEQRIKQLNLEATVSGRIQVISDGDRPLGAYKDTHLTLAAAGGGGGALVGFGLVLGLALLDRRLRSPDEAEAIAAAATGTNGTGGSGSILGLLPRLPDDLSDPNQAAIAAHCVHEVRTSLQLWGRHARHRVYAITSPGAGAGKTSLTLALGVSFATAKLRTLVVDCDLVGCGLTTRVNRIVNQRLGQVLRDLGRVSDAQLDHALDQSRRTGRRLGDVVVEMGLMTADDVEQAATLQQQRQVGVIDALHGTPVAHCTAETGIPNLHLLSAGGATSRDVPLLSSHAMQDLVDEVRRTFDVVLIDTGPILGSLEAQLVSALADGVVVTVSKGAPRSLVVDAMNQLAGVGARVAGVVFNRASAADVTIYSSSGSQGRSVSVAGIGRQPLPPADAGRAANFGPLAAAVARCAPVSKSA